MKKVLSILVATALTGAIVSPALADKPSIVNGMPCVAEMCVGDYLKNLGNVKWTSVNKKALATVVHTKFCEFKRFEFSYISKSGKKVDVVAETYPLNNGKSSELVVTMITTTLPNTRLLSADRLDQLERDVAQKYGSLSLTGLLVGSAGTSVSMDTGAPGDKQIFLRFSNGLTYPEITRLLSKQPGCISPKINID
jgi:hypothetical protein